MEDYQIGQEACYHESGDIYRVQVLQNDSDDEWLRYYLRILSVEQTTAKNPPQNGIEFSCEKRRGIAVQVLWHLLDD